MKSGPVTVTEGVCVEGKTTRSLRHVAVTGLGYQRAQRGEIVV